MSIDIAEHRRIHAEMADRGICRAIGLSDHWREVSNFPRERGRVTFKTAYHWINFAGGKAFGWAYSDGIARPITGYGV